MKLAEQSRVLRNEEFIQMKKDRVVIHTGHLAGHLLADVLLADLMENKEVVQQQELPMHRRASTSIKDCRGRKRRNSPCRMSSVIRWGIFI